MKNPDRMEDTPMSGNPNAIDTNYGDYTKGRNQMMNLWQSSLDRQLEKYYEAMDASPEGEHPETDLEQALRRKTMECQTCKNRKYQDGSDDSAVSYQSPTKLGSGNVEAAVRSHEREHVIRNNAKAEQEGGKVTHSSVSITHAYCPECGRRYVSGGETFTRTVTPGENKKAQENYGQFIAPGRLDVKG
jgi:hypothetical protein